MFNCYSAAIATWIALADDRWDQIMSPGLHLTLTDEGDGLFGFGHFPPGLRAKLGLARTGGEDRDEALDGLSQELATSGRVIVAGDAFHQPWHVAFERRHVPHWYVIAEGPGGLRIVDPFSCRTELGLQLAHVTPVSAEGLAPLLDALPDDDRVLRLRESLAFGDVAELPPWCPFQWFVQSEVGSFQAPVGAQGPEALLRLATHFRQHGQDPEAYRQADDIWSIGRHRAFLSRRAALLAEAGARAGAEAEADPEADRHELTQWIDAHCAPLVKRWGHVSPLMMQATLSLRAGRSASASLPETLEDLASRERAAARALPAALR
jgi:hypothetical protein